MSTEENVAIARRLIEEGFSDGNEAICDELVSIDAVEHQRGLKPGAAGTKATIRTLHRWFSDFRLEIEEVTASGDRVWRFPMWKAYGRTLVGDTADLQNIAEGKAPSPAGSIFGAKFLEEFVDYPWAHLDIAGTAWKSGASKGATGRPVGLLTHYLLDQAR